uniref:Uncharacterized protein n=1 Tax=Balamuthia mandrillaris TaxID=66527 RepID=A0A0K1HNZ1_9EUKA|nr:hypothetical protein [Balamuthia mandrillaris]AKT93895.1 hypothetical protein [Balamuthia mandrillaris]
MVFRKLYLLNNNFSILLVSITPFGSQKSNLFIWIIVFFVFTLYVPNISLVLPLCGFFCLSSITIRYSFFFSNFCNFATNFILVFWVICSFIGDLVVLLCYFVTKFF